MDTISLPARKVGDALLLVAAAEVEPRDVLTRVHLPRAEHDRVEPAGDLLPHSARRIEVGAGLVDIGKLHGLADGQHTGVRRLLAGDHAEQRRLASAVRADDTDDAAWREREAEIFDEQLVAEAL